MPTVMAIYFGAINGPLILIISCSFGARILRSYLGWLGLWGIDYHRRLLDLRRRLHRNWLLALLLHHILHHHLVLLLILLQLSLKAILILLPLLLILLCF